MILQILFMEAKMKSYLKERLLVTASFTYGKKIKVMDISQIVADSDRFPKTWEKDNLYKNHRTLAL